MSYLPEETSAVLVPSLATCGGDTGPLFQVARAITEKGKGELWVIVPELLHPLAQPSLKKLEAESRDGIITTESVLRRYGLPAHFHEMNDEANRGMASVAREIPPEIRAIAHTLLPLREDGTYVNEGRTIRFRGIVPLGAQDGVLVVHLAGVFACKCSKEAVRELLHEQASDPELMSMVDKVKTLDYEGTQLRKATLRAKEELGL